MPSDQRRFQMYALAIGGLFVALRILVVRQLLASPLYGLPILDSDFYLSWAASLAQGHGHPQGPFWLSPLYPVFMAGIFKALGSLSVTVIIAAQTVLSLGTLAILMALTRKLFGDATALATGLLAALYAPWLYFDVVLLSAPLILFLNALALLLLVTKTEFGPDRSEAKPASAAVWLAIGGLLALSALARPLVLLFAAGLAVWIVRRRSPGWGTRLALYSLALCVVLGAVLMRNWKVAGSAVLTTSSGGVNFFIGNRAGASGIYDELNFITSFDPAREAQGYRAEAARRTGREMTLDEASGYWAGQALDDIVHSPGGWLRLELRKLWLTLQREEMPTNVSFRGVMGFSPLLGIVPLRWGLLLPFAAAGIFLAWRRRDAWKLLGLYVGTYIGGILLFFSASEYRFPLILALLPAAGCMIVEAARCVRERDYRALTLACGVYLAALVVANFPSRSLTLATRPWPDYYNMAAGAIDRGRPMDAMPLYVRALAINPEYKEARVGLARILWSLGNFDDARQEFAAAGVAPPDSVQGAPLESFFEEFYQFTEDAEWEKALAFLDQRFPLDKDAPTDIWINRAMVEFMLKHPAPALSAMNKAMAKDPASPEIPYKAAMLALELPDTAQADSLLQLSLKRYAAYAPSRIALARMALARHDTLAARAQFYELQRIRIPEDSVIAKAQRLALDLGERTDAIYKPQD